MNRRNICWMMQFFLYKASYTKPMRIRKETSKSYHEMSLNPHFQYNKRNIPDSNPQPLPKPHDQKRNMNIFPFTSKASLAFSVALPLAVTPPSIQTTYACQPSRTSNWSSIPGSNSATYMLASWCTGMIPFPSSDSWEEEKLPRMWWNLLCRSDLVWLVGWGGRGVGAGDWDEKMEG